MLFEADENGGQYVAGLVGGDGERGLFQHAADFFLRQDDLFLFLELGKGRKFVGAEAVDLIKGGSGADAAGVAFVHFDLDFGVGQFTNDAEELFHGDGGRALFLDAGFDSAGDGDIEVGGGEFDAILFGADQDIGKNGQGGPGADDVLNRLEA